jgi:hypothetical protein
MGRLGAWLLMLSLWIDLLRGKIDLTGRRLR